MTEVLITDKQEFLNKNYPFKEVPDLADRKRCIHCDTEFVVGTYKVFTDEQGARYICCPKAPECDGTVIDWVEVRH